MKLQLLALSRTLLWFLIAAALALGVLPGSASAADPSCSGATTITMTPVPMKADGSEGVATSPAVLTCIVSGLPAIHVGGTLNSTMLVSPGKSSNARGYVQIQWLSAGGGPLGVWDTGDDNPIDNYNGGDIRWVGRVKDEPLDLAVQVPPGAAQAIVRLLTKATGSVTVGGIWSVAGLEVSSGVIVNVSSVNTKIAKAFESVTWKLSTLPADAAGTFHVTMRDIDGNVRNSWDVQKASTDTTVDVALVGQPKGYYEVTVEFGSPTGQAPKNVWPFVSLPEVTPDPRIGMGDSSWWFSDAESLHMLSKAGVGSVRTQISDHFGDCENWMSSAWPQADTHADEIMHEGMEVVSNIQNFPECARYGIPTDPNYDPAKPNAGHHHPLDYYQAYRYGQEYALNIGKKIRSIEYWNEPNALGLIFFGYPWQYASGLKAFSAGIKSVDADIRVLVGSAAADPNSPWRFFDEVWENGTAKFVDALNQHYYGGNPMTMGAPRQFYDLDGFQASAIEPMLGDYDLGDHPSWMTETGFSLYRDQTPGSPTEGSLLPSKVAQANHLVKTLTGSFGAGYERAFYFMWSEFREWDYLMWGIARYQNHPHPAYLSLAILADHLKNASPIKVQTKDLWLPDVSGTPTKITTWTVFFEKAAGRYVAVSWAGGDAIRALLMPDVTITDVFGRIVANPGAIAENDQSVYLLSGLTSLPTGGDVKDVPQHTRPVAAAPQPLMLLVDKMYVDGVEQIMAPGTGNVGMMPWGYSETRSIHVPVLWGSIVEVRTKALDGGYLDVAGAQVECLGDGPEMVLLTAERPAPNADGDYVCRYRAQLKGAAYDGIRVTARAGAFEDSAHIPVKPVIRDDDIAYKSFLIKDGQCRTTWDYLPTVGTDPSRKVYPITVDAQGAPPSCTVDFRATVNEASDNTWFHPRLKIAAGELVGAARARVTLSPLSGCTMPPSSPKFNMEWNWSNGLPRNLWTTPLTLEEDSTSTYTTGPLTNAGRQQPATGSLEVLDFSKVEYLHIIWSGNKDTMPAGTYGARIESLEIGMQPPTALPLEVTPAVTASAASAQLVFTNASATSGNIGWLALPSTATASYIDAIQSDANAGALTIAAGGSATATFSSLTPNTDYAVYFFTEADPSISPYSTYTPLQTVSFTTKPECDSDASCGKVDLDCSAGTCLNVSQSCSCSFGGMADSALVTLLVLALGIKARRRRRS